MESYIYNTVKNTMAEADYEVVLEAMERKITKNGKSYISLKFRVREDVEQSYKNKCVFDSIWPDKDNPQLFDTKKINRLLGTQKVKEGQTFATLNDVINFLEGSKMIAHVKPVYDEYKGCDVDTIKYYKSTQYPDKTLGTTNLPPVADNELPF